MTATMGFDPQIIPVVEKLDYRATPGDVAAASGLNLNLAERGLLALASDAGAHLQVAETGDIVYQFPRNFRTVLRNKFFRLRLQEWWEKVWNILFYLIRISFGTILIVSIVLIFVTIAIILISLNSSRDGGGGRRGGRSFVFIPRLWAFDWLWFYDPHPSRSYNRKRKPQQSASSDSEMNFLEAVFSFLFGDGNPNSDLDDRRWSSIATVIRNYQGAVTAEQIAPYLDDLGDASAREYEEYMLPVLSRFNGRPEVSPDGELVYHFPELQTTAKQHQQGSVSEYLQEYTWQFSQASSGQKMMAIGLGSVNIVGALVLGHLLGDGAIAAQLGGLVAFVASIYWLLLGYGIAFLSVPLLRYFWLQWRNTQIESRNKKRENRSRFIDRPTPKLQKKLAYASEFASETVIDRDEIAYTTEKDLTQQEFEQADKIDEEWRRRLEGGS